MSPLQWTKKPPKREFGRITNSIKTIQSTIQEFANNVSPPYSRCWSGGVFDGNVCNKNWVEQSIIGLDFDSGEQTVEEVYSILKEYNIIPNLHYKTFSHTEECPRFRVVIFLDRPITNKKTFQLLMDSFDIILKIDKQCKDFSRRFLGGKQAVITNETPLTLEIGIKFCNKIQLKNNIKENSSNGTKDNSSGFSPEFSEELSSYYSSNDFFEYNSNIIEGETRIRWEKDLKNIRIFEEFLSGTWMHHDQLFGLATNLKYISGGLKKMEHTMTKYNDKGTTQYSKNNLRIIEFIRKNNYFPMAIKKFSPYLEDSQLENLISVLRSRSRIKIITPTEKIELKDAENKFNKRFNEVLEIDDTNKVYIFKLPTAIGKTTLLTNVERSIIALPTNDLKNEVKSKMKVESVTTPDSIEFLDPSLNNLVKRYYTVGLPNKAMGIIRSVSEGGYGADLNDIQIAGQYLYQLMMSNDVEKTILTTHKRLIHADDTPHNTIIFDEDPLNSLIEIKELKIQDLSALRFQCEELGVVLNYFKNISKGLYKTPNELRLDKEKISEKCNSFSGIDTNIFEFFTSDYFYYDPEYKGGATLFYVEKKHFPKNKRIVIMSATISPEIYQKLYPDINFEVMDISNVKQQGNIIQYTDHSYSRSSLKGRGHKLSEELQDKKVITFMKFKDTFENPVNDIHFGNCSGYDTLNGQDLAIVGTPHGNVIQYYLIGRLLNIDFEITDSMMNNQIVEYNGFEFTFYCFHNPELRMIQFYIIESNLIQAVGRGRTLRNDNTVELYSNFPLYITTEFKRKTG
ncbi:MAG: hypothetical protein BGO86_04575 [Chryseobacterium sp. 36-9]|nr:MAG: hypothetical protein BGO86_04575 [Chryseobacterium sp. 36-9]